MFFTTSLFKIGCNRASDAVAAIEDYEKYSALAKLDSVRFVVSNTTEAGIVYSDSDQFDAKPPKTYPGKLTKFFHRLLY